MTVAVSVWWIVGWAVGGLVVAIAAVLLVTLIVLGRRIASQAADITAALDRAQGNTSPMFDIARVNLALDRLRRSLHSIRTGGP